MVEELLTLFISPDTVERMGNWYPRVLAVMSCVIPFTILLAFLGFFGLVLWSIYKLLK